MKNLLTIFNRPPTAESLVVAFVAFIAIVVVSLYVWFSWPWTVLPSVSIPILVCVYRIAKGLDQ